MRCSLIGIVFLSFCLFLPGVLVHGQIYRPAFLPLPEFQVQICDLADISWPDESLIEGRNISRISIREEVKSGGNPSGESVIHVSEGKYQSVDYYPSDTNGTGMQIVWARNSNGKIISYDNYIGGRLRVRDTVIYNSQGAIDTILYLREKNGEPMRGIRMDKIKYDKLHLPAEIEICECTEGNNCSAAVVYMSFKVERNEAGQIVRVAALENGMPEDYTVVRVYQYNTAGQLSTFVLIDPHGGYTTTTAYIYNEKRQLVKVQKDRVPRQPSYFSQTSSTWLITWNTEGLPLSVTKTETETQKLFRELTRFFEYE